MQSILEIKGAKKPKKQSKLDFSHLLKYFHDNYWTEITLVHISRLFYKRSELHIALIQIFQYSE